MKIEDLIVGKKYKHKNGNFAFYAGKNEFDSPVFELEKHVGTTITIPKNYKYVASNTYWAYLGLEREFSPVEEDLKSLEVKEQSSDELLAEAKRWYPIGTKFKSVYNSEGPSSEVEVVNTDFSYEDSYLDDYGYVIQNRKTGGWLYSSVKGWAEIISKPETKTDHRYKFNVGEEFIVNFDPIDYPQHYQLGSTVAVIDRSETRYFSSQFSDKAYYKWKNLLTNKEFHTTENCTFTQNLTKITQEKSTTMQEHQYYRFKEDLFSGCSQRYKLGTIVKGYFDSLCNKLHFINNDGQKDFYSILPSKLEEVTEKEYLKYQELWSAYLICIDKYKVGDKVRSIHSPENIHTLINLPKISNASVDCDSKGSTTSVVDLYFNGKYAEIIKEEESVSQDYKPGDYLIDINHDTNGTNYVIGLFKEYTDSAKTKVRCDWYHKTDTDRILYTTSHPTSWARKATLQEISENTPHKGITVNNPIIDVLTLGNKPIVLSTVQPSLEPSPSFWKDPVYHYGIDPFSEVKQDKHLDIEHQDPVIVKSSKNKKSKLVIIN